MTFPRFYDPGAYRVWARRFHEAGKTKSVRVGLIVAQEALRKYSIEEDLRHRPLVSEDLLLDHLRKSRAILDALEAWTQCPCRVHAEACSCVTPTDDDLRWARGEFFGSWTIGPRNHLHVTSELLKVVQARGNFEQFVMKAIAFTSECGLRAQGVDTLSWDAMKTIGLIGPETPPD